MVTLCEHLIVWVLSNEIARWSMCKTKLMSFSLLVLVNRRRWFVLLIRNDSSPIQWQCIYSSTRSIFLPLPRCACACCAPWKALRLSISINSSWMIFFFFFSSSSICVWCIFLPIIDVCLTTTWFYLFVQIDFCPPLTPSQTFSSVPHQYS